MNIMLFTNPNNYFIKNIEDRSIIREAKDFFKEEEGRGPWIWRFILTNRKNSTYVIIPPNLSCKYNEEKATENNFIVFKLTDNAFSSIEENDEAYIINYISEIRRKTQTEI